MTQSTTPEGTATTATHPRKITPRGRRWTLRVSGAALLMACGLAVVNVSSVFIDQKSTPNNVLMLVGTAIFVAAGVTTTRMLASEAARHMNGHGLGTPGTVVRVGITLGGYVMIAVTALSLFGAHLQQLLVGTALTGVVIGIAAQQTLGNLFAGLMILVVRPFRIGQDITVRSGPLNGPFGGKVLAMGLTYTTLETEAGTTLVPNSAMLSAAITVEPASTVELAGVAVAPTAHKETDGAAADSGETR